MEIITSAEGEDILTEILSNVGSDDDQVEALATQFELTPKDMRLWLEKVKAKPSDVTLR